ncbi:Mu transposase C-terminal domain-containing protein [Candidatus Magnetominusculus dajiuhuensis]|uniref:Mu transposase C-terminal domain-containing protein n=1 Tax=Candidatus Magnetominusculus dajiuhuensis TaxID=3137712 RepID=UPI003B43419E
MTNTEIIEITKRQKPVSRAGGSARVTRRELPAPAASSNCNSPGARQIALARFDLLTTWQKYRAEAKGGRSDADIKFLAIYSSGLILPHVKEIIGKVSLRTLYGWAKLLNDSVNSGDWQNLLPGWSYGEGEPGLTPDEKAVFQRQLLHSGKINIGTATNITKYYLNDKGISSPSAPIKFRRWAEWFKKNNYDIWVLSREGEKALKDKVERYIIRDVSVLEVGDVFIADGHTLNFQVIHPFTGKPCRATLVGYLDWKSYDLVGYEIMCEENTQCIASAMRNAIIRFGRTPKVSYQDNGKAFRARFFNGSKDFNESGLTGLFQRLSIKPVYAQPYNARAKLIGRFFGEFTESFEKLTPSYIGNSIANKPAHLMRNEKFHKALHKSYIPTIDEAVQMIESWLKYHRAKPCPHVKGKTIGEVFNAGRGMGVNLADLDDLMMDSAIRQIGRQGIRFLNADYYNEELYGLTKQAIIKYSLSDLSYVKVYRPEGTYLGIAQRYDAIHPMAAALGDVADMAELKFRLTQQRSLSKATRQAVRGIISGGKDIKPGWDGDIANRPAISYQPVKHLGDFGDRAIPDEAVMAEDYLTDTTETQVAPSVRPDFDEAHERYVWHLKYGFQTEEDMVFRKDFESSDTYDMLFRYFEKQG